MKFDKKKYSGLFLAVFLLFLSIYYWQAFVLFIKVLFKAAMPLFVGAFIAYVVNILMSKYEVWFFGRTEAKIAVKVKRPVSMVLAYLTAIAVLAVIIWLIVPQLVSCIQIIVAFLLKLPNTITELINRADREHFIPEAVVDYLSKIDWQSKAEQLVSWVSTGVGSAVNTLAKTLVGVVSGVITSVIGIIFSVYLLLDKDRLKRQITKLFVNYTPKKVYSKLFYVFRIFNESFRRFIIGQFTEAVILGILCTVCMLILRLPYATMIGALIAFTALIPIAGAYIGAATGAVMILTVSPVKALWFIVFIIILQQIEGNLIYPRVVGSSIGLPGLWVLAAVTVGGGCFGVIGMLIGVPLASAVYRMIKEDIGKKEADMPSDAI